MFVQDLQDRRHGSGHRGAPPRRRRGARRGRQVSRVNSAWRCERRACFFVHVTPRTTMQLGLAIVAAAGCLLLVAAAAFVLIPHHTAGADPTMPPTSSTDQYTPPPSPNPQAPKTKRPGASACECTDVDHAVCKGSTRWRNHCHAFCNGEYAVEDCPGVKPIAGGCGAKGQIDVCYDNPWTADVDSCSLLTGFDTSRSRDCKPGESDKFQDMRKRAGA